MEVDQAKTAEPKLLIVLQIQEMPEFFESL